MAFELLRTDYVDATFEGLRRYLIRENGDGSVSIHDITNYTVKEKSFFGAKDANTINTAVNAILAALENGTDLYEVFTQFFELQKALFLEASDAKQGDFAAYITQLRDYMDRKWDELKTEYTGDIQYFKDVQENAFKVWFQMVRDQLTNDVAGHLQIQIGDLNQLETEAKDDLVSAINSLTLSYDETMAVLCGVKTLHVTLNTNDGERVAGVTVTLHNVDTGQEVAKEYGGEEIVFDILVGMTYRISMSDIEGYEAPDPEEFLVVEGETQAFVFKYYDTNTRRPLNEYTWKKIAEYSESGEAGEKFNIGDTKEFTLTTGEKCTAVIMDFSHDQLASDTTKTAGITFGMLNCLEQEYRMNDSYTNSGGYDGSEMFNTITTEFYGKLPEDMKQHIKKVRKKASSGSNSATIKSFDVAAFLLAEIEVFNATKYSFAGEGTFYPYFATNADSFKKLGETGEICDWWLRSPADNYTAFCKVAAVGNDENKPANMLADTKYGLSAGFCI